MQMEPAGFNAVFQQQKNDMLGPLPASGGSACPALLSTLPIHFHPSDLNTSVPSVTPGLTRSSFVASGLYLTSAVPASKHQTSLFTALPV